MVAPCRYRFCAMAQAKNPWLRWSAHGKTFSAFFRSAPKFFVDRMSVNKKA